MYPLQDDEPGAAGGGAAEPNAELEALKAENAKLQAKIAEANKHAKAAEKAAAEEARKKAEAEGNHEQLYKSAMAELDRERAERAKLLQENANKEIHALAMREAAKIAVDADAAELLAEQFAKRLRYTDEGVKVTDKAGGLTVSPLDALTKEFQSSARFARLVKGNQSAGGGASGSDKKGGSAVMTRKEFDALGPVERANFIKEQKGKIIDQ